MRVANQLDSALIVADPLIESARAEEDSSFLVSLLVLKGRIQNRQGREPDSEPILQEAASLAEAIGDTMNHCRALRTLAAAVGNQGRAVEAMALFRRHLAASRAYGLPRQEGFALLGLSRQHFKFGQFDSSLVQAKQALASFDDVEDGYGMGQATTMIGNAQILLGEYDDALLSLRRAMDLGREEDAWQILNGAANSLGSLEYYLGDPGAALGYFREIYEMQRAKGFGPQTVIPVGINMATCLTELGRYADAAEALEEVGKLCREGNYLDMLGSVHFHQARLLTHQGLYHEAAALARGGLALGDRLRIPNRIDGHVLLSTCMAERDSIEAAIVLLEEGMRLLEGLPTPGSRIVLENQLGKLLPRLGRHEEALGYLLEAEREAGEIGRENLQLVALGHAARAYRALDRPDSSLALLTRAARIWESIRTVPLDPEWREQRGTAGRLLYADLAALLLECPPETPPSERTRAAFDRLQPFKARTLMERMLGPGKVVVQSDENAIPPPPSLDQLQREVLRPGELLLDAFLGPEEGFLFAVTTDSCRVVSLPSQDELDRKLDLFLQTVSVPPEQGVSPDLAFVAEISASISAQLLGEVGDLVASSDRILVSPDGVLNLIPFSVLRQPTARAMGNDPAPVDSVPADARLIHPEQLDVSQSSDAALGTSKEFVRIPSASYLAWQRSERQQSTAVNTRAPGTRVLALTPAESHGGEDLPWARREVRSLARRFRGVEARLIEADSGSVTGLLPGFQVLHFAAHSRVDDQHPWRSTIFLYPPGADGNPRADRIAQMQLPARLVTLSSCLSAGGRVLSGEGVQGLSSAFLAAGVPTVIAALWNVDDRATAKLMAHFYDQLAEGVSVATALQGAQGALRRDPSTRLPHFWAGFIVVGEGGTRVDLQQRHILLRYWMVWVLFIAGLMIIGVLGLRRWGAISRKTQRHG
jgi:CHAT domain-containing protein/tetratricopeptide (TPR) repeat protein